MRFLFTVLLAVAAVQSLDSGLTFASTGAGSAKSKARSCAASIVKPEVKTYSSLADFEQKDFDSKVKFFWGLSDLQDIWGSHHEEIGFRSGRYFPRKNFLKDSLQSKWGEPLQVSYADLKRKVSEQPYAEVKPDGRIRVVSKGGNTHFLNLVLNSKIENLFRGQDDFHAAVHVFLHKFYVDGQTGNSERAKLFAALETKVNVERLKERELGVMSTEGRALTALAADQGFRQLSNDKLADYLIENILARNYWFFSTSESGAASFQKNRIGRSVYRYRFHKEDFLASVSDEYKNAIHFGSENVDGLAHWEIAFPLREDRATIIKLIKSLEPL